MSTRLVLSVISTLVWETILVGVVLFLLPEFDIEIPVPGLIILMVALGIFSLIAYRVGSEALMRKPVVGLPSMVGSHGKVVILINPRGTVRIYGELWEAVSTGGKIDTGENVSVIGQDGLRLTVERVKQTGGEVAQKPGYRATGLSGSQRIFHS